MDQTRSEMIGLLKKGSCSVTFKKDDGERSTRNLTLNPDFIPEEIEIKGKAGGTNKNLITAWDLGKAGWINFRPEKVTKNIKLNK